jgi:FkbM family methyltransferase
MNSEKRSVAETLEVEHPIKVVDIGANPIDGTPPYKPLLDRGLAHVYGFEPNPTALEQLERNKGPYETYVPHAVYDGNEHTLKVCKDPGMTSLLEPNAELLSYFHGIPEWAEVVERFPIPTVRLDDVEEIETIDYLKIDIQGGELEVFRNGTNKLRDCLVIHTEVEFLPMYEKQPLFSEIELFLRGEGFTFHRFEPLVSRIVQPLLINNDIYREFSQVTWGDAVFIKDFTKFDQLDPEGLKKMALILNDVYSSADIVIRALMAHDAKTNSDLTKRYGEFMSQSG